MATITDVLQTVFQFVGLPQYVAAMQNATRSTTQLAQAQTQASAASQRQSSSLQDLYRSVQIAHQIVSRLTRVVEEDIQQFADDEDQLFQTAIAFRNLGESLPFAELVRIADQMKKIAAVDDEAIVQLGGALARLGATGSQIEPAIKAVVDLAQGTGQDLNAALGEFESALLGRGLALKKLGVEFKATGDRARDMIALEKELERVFAGAAGARAGTAAGQVDQIKIALEDLRSEMGRFFAGRDNFSIRFFKGQIEDITHLFEKINKLLGRPTAAEEAAKAAGQVPGGSAADRAAKETAANTAEMKKLMKEGFNVGPTARSAFNTRALRAALRGIG